MSETMIQIFVDDENDSVRLVGIVNSDKALATIAAAAMQEIIAGPGSEANKEKATEVLRALGITRVERVPSNRLV